MRSRAVLAVLALASGTAVGLARPVAAAPVQLDQPALAYAYFLLKERGHDPLEMATIIDRHTGSLTGGALHIWVRECPASAACYGVAEWTQTLQPSEFVVTRGAGGVLHGRLRTTLLGKPLAMDWSAGGEGHFPKSGPAFSYSSRDYQSAVVQYEILNSVATFQGFGARRGCKWPLSTLAVGTEVMTAKAAVTETPPSDSLRKRLIATGGKCA